MDLASDLDYPLIAIADSHGQRAELERLVDRLERLPEWDDSALVFLGDYVDRGEDVPGTIDLVLDLLERPAGGSAVLGNHDLALTRAAGLDGRAPSPYWVEAYRTRYDHEQTFLGYLGRRPNKDRGVWKRELDALRDAIPARHRAFLASLPWVVESPGHLFLHCGLSPELGASAAEQVAAMRGKKWNRGELRPRAGSATNSLWQPDYPVWIGADRSLSKRPLPHPGKIQVTGHVRVSKPDANAVRIRIDTSGGFGRLTACLLRSADAEPIFLASES